MYTHTCMCIYIYIYTHTHNKQIYSAPAELGGVETSNVAACGCMSAQT